MSPIKVIITGATGMVGEGVLHECLTHDQISEVLVISRKPYGINHPKLKELIHHDFFDINPLKQSLGGYDACFFCLGVSSVGMKEADFARLTFDLTLHFASVLASVNPNMMFTYVSGVGTDSTEKGRTMWARVKGRTENALSALPFRQVYNFRPGYLHPTAGLKNVLPYYAYFSWLYPVGRRFFPQYVSTLAQLGLAMINVVLFGYTKNIIEVRDIKILAGKTGQF